MKNSDNKRKVIIWSAEVIRLIEGKPIGGIAVQMYFWAHVFAENGWKVFSFCENKEKVAKENIVFMPKRNIKRINILLEWWYAFFFILKVHPDIVVFRGANRELYPLAWMSTVLGTKLLFFAASDVNFELGKECVGSELNRRLYQRGVRACKYSVVQNKHQQDTIWLNYGKESLQLYNIWGKTKILYGEQVPTSDVVWVANFRRLKRAEWVMAAAKSNPHLRFCMAGGEADDKQYFESMLQAAEAESNVLFLGARSFFYTSNLVAKSRVLLCTSTFEGFPNTFLQAWSHGLPVISTVDPSNIISNNKLGEVVRTEEELAEALRRILSDEDYYKQIQCNVNEFFKENCSPQAGYEKLMQYIL